MPPPSKLTPSNSTSDGGAVDDAGTADGGEQDAGGGGGAGDGGGFSADASVDLDLDGLDDGYESALATTYLPFLSVDPADKCPLSVIVYRSRPHPQNAELVLIVYDRLYERDCGIGGHVGDNEVFSITVDPKKMPPLGITAMRAIAHQATLCGKTSTCDRCGGSACTMTTTATGALRPVVFSSVNKHGGYVSLNACSTTCLDSCVLAATSTVPPLVNAGEPNAPLTNNLTTSGFITAANGWTEQTVMNFDPWNTAIDFGGAGNVADDLVDTSFVTPACAAP